jgi:hypothetical protein
LIAHGTIEDTKRAKTILNRTKPEVLNQHLIEETSQVTY